MCHPDCGAKADQQLALYGQIIPGIIMAVPISEVNQLSGSAVRSTGGLSEVAQMRVLRVDRASKC